MWPGSGHSKTVAHGPNFGSGFSPNSLDLYYAVVQSTVDITPMMDKVRDVARVFLQCLENSFLFFIQALSGAGDQGKVVAAFAKTYSEMAIENLLGFANVST